MFMYLRKKERKWLFLSSEYFLCKLLLVQRERGKGESSRYLLRRDTREMNCRDDKDIKMMMATTEKMSSADEQ